MLISIGIDGGLDFSEDKMPEVVSQQLVVSIVGQEKSHEKAMAKPTATLILLDIHVHKQLIVTVNASTARCMATQAVGFG